MLNRQLIFAILFAFSIYSGCEKAEPLSPGEFSGGPELAAFGPPNPCGAAVGYDLKLYSLGSSLGEAVLQNDSLELYLSFPLDQGWVLKEMYLYIGPRGSVPVDENGNADVEAFPYISVLNRPLNTYTYKVPLGSISPCDEYVVLLEVAQIDQFGTMYNHRQLIFDGSSILNLEWVGHCIDAC